MAHDSAAAVSMARIVSRAAPILRVAVQVRGREDDSGAAGHLLADERADQRRQHRRVHELDGLRNWRTRFARTHKTHPQEVLQNHRRCRPVIASLAGGLFGHGAGE